MQAKSTQSIRKLTTAGVLAAAIILLTSLVSIPMPGGLGYINLGDAGVLLACTVRERVAGGGLARLGFEGGELLLPSLPDAPGTRLRVRVRARDVSVATEEPRGISVRNVLPVVLEAIGPGTGQEVMLRLRLGAGGVLLSRITAEAARRLDLRPGQPLWALVKSVALSQGGAAREEEPG